MAKIYVRIMDANIEGHISLATTDSVEDIRELLVDNRGRWYDYDGNGVALLHNPSAFIYYYDPDEVDDPYPDVLIEFEE